MEQSGGAGILAGFRIIGQYLAMRRLTAIIALLLAGTAVRAADNVLIVVADDLGVDILAAYGEGGACSGNGSACTLDSECPNQQTCEADYPTTPTIDQLALEGVLFRNAWAAPNCSPMRATVQTGRYGFRNGVLSPGGGNNLGPDELMLPQALDAVGSGYAHAAIGKWHLGGGATGPIDRGYSHHSGPLSNAGDYYSWDRTVDGVTEPCEPGSVACPIDSYITTVNVDDALSWIGLQTDPWFVWFSFSAPHGPQHIPPHDLVTPETLARLPVDQDGNPAPPGSSCDGYTRECYVAAVEAMDREMARLLAGVPDDTVVVFVGDNGTPSNATRAPFVSSQAKGSLFEGGVNVPIIVRMPDGTSAGEESPALVHTADLFSTVLDVAGVQLPDDGRFRDGRSLLPLIEDPDLPWRETVFAQDPDHQTVRDERFKLIRRTDHDELYDLEEDPFELDDLLEGSCSLTQNDACHSDPDCPVGETCDLPNLNQARTSALARLDLALADLAEAAGRIPDGSAVPGAPLLLGKNGSQVVLQWDASCKPDDLDYSVYEGALGAWSSHTPRTCSTGGLTEASFSPAGGDRYYLVVPQNGMREGFHGGRSDGVPRTPGATTCLRSSYGGCDGP